MNSLIEGLINEKLIFDGTKDDTTTDVWRIDQKFKRGWIGPHRVYTNDFEPQDEWKYEILQKLTKKYGNDLKNNPSPLEDFPDEEFGMKKGSMNQPARNRLFGFPSKESAEAWFTKKGLEGLEEIGFKLRVIKAKRVWLSKSKKQILFEPA